MDRPANLSEFQVALAKAFFSLEESREFVVAGGAALVALDLIARPTEDLDLFAASPTTVVTPAKDAFMRMLRDRSCGVNVLQDAPTFCRMVISRGAEETVVDLAIDSPPHQGSTVTVLGPTLAPAELAGRKLLALFGRAEARDFADVYVLAQRFGTDALLDQARTIDSGFDPAVLAQMLRTVNRFDRDEIPLPAAALPAALEFFSTWARELS